MLSLVIALLLSFLIGWVSQRMGLYLVNAMGQLLAFAGRRTDGDWRFDDAGDFVGG